LKSEWNPKIRLLNEELKKLAATQPHYHFIDFSKFLTNEKGELAPQFHKGDGVHLSEEGYAVWSAHLKKFLQEVLASSSH